MKIDRATLRRQQLKEYYEFEQKLMTQRLRERELRMEKFVDAKYELENRNRLFQSFIAAVSDEETKKELILRQ